MRIGAALFFTFLLSSGLALAQDMPGTEQGRKSQVEDQQVFEVGEVVVTDHKMAHIERAGTTDVVTASDMEARGETSLVQPLEMLPGIQVYTHTKGHSRIRMRGFDQDKLVLLVDGIPVTDIYSTDVDVSAVSVLGISKIVINRGVSSALYGTDGALGSINVVTRRPTRMFGSGRVEYGLYNNATYHLAQGGPVGNLYYWVSGTLATSNGFKPSARLDAATRREWFDRLMRYDLYGKTFEDVLFPARNQYIQDDDTWNHQDFNKYHVNAKAGYKLGRSMEVGLNTGFYYYQGRTNTYDSGAYSDWNLAQEKWRINRRPAWDDDQVNVKDFGLRNRSFVWPEVYRISIAPYFTGRWSDLSLRFVPFVTHAYARQEGYASNDHSYTKGQSALYTDRRQDPYDPFYDIKYYGSAGLRLMPSYRFSRDHRLNAMLHWRRDTFAEQGQAISPAVSPNIHALTGGCPYEVSDLAAHYVTLALEDEFKMFGRLKGSLGVSYDVQKLSLFRQRDGLWYGDVYKVKDDPLLAGTRDSFNPVAGFIYEPIRKTLRLQWAGSIKSRFPTLNEYDKIREAEYDQGLKPERSYNSNAGFELWLADRKVRLRSDYFISVMDDRIYKINRDDPPVNIERMVSQGNESILSLDFKNLAGLFDLSATLAYTYVHARNHDDSDEEQVNKGDWVEFTPEHQVTADVRFKFKSRTTATIWATYLHGARIYVMNQAPEEFASYSTDYFTTAKLHNPFMLNLRISQKLGKYAELYALARNLLDDYRMDPFNPGPGRMVWLGLSATWERR